MKLISIWLLFLVILVKALKDASIQKDNASATNSQVKDEKASIENSATGQGDPSDAQMDDYLFHQYEQQLKRAPSIRRVRRPFKMRKVRKLLYFLSTTPFVHGDTVFGLGRTTSGILFIYFATMYSVYVLSTTVLLFQRRRDPSLSKFPLWLSHFLPAGMNILIVVLGFVRHMFRAKYPCFIVLWTYGLLVPMYVVMILQGRSLSIIFEYHWNKRMQALLQASEPRTSTTDQSGVLVLPDECKPRELDPQQVRYSKDWLWIKKYGMITTIAGIFAVQFIMTLSIQIVSPYYQIWPKMIVYRCAGMWETILPMVSLLMYMFVIPLYLFIQLRRINDSCGVRQDIYAAVTQSAWIAVLSTVVRHVYFIGKFVGYVPTGFAIMANFGILHYHTVCAPLLRVYQWQWSRSRVKRRIRKIYILKRRIESLLFPRALRIRLPKSDKFVSRENTQPTSTHGNQIRAPKPVKAPAVLESPHSGPETRNRRHQMSVLNSVASPSSSVRPESAASPAASQILLNPDLKPPTFQQVLQDETLCELFERYTLLEFSRENLLFYRAVCAMRTTYSALPPVSARIFLVEKSKSLAAQFISQNAPAEVNIPGPVRKRIETRIAELDIDLSLFEEAQREVFKLMQSWSYPRFLRTLPEAEIRRFNRKAARRNSITAEVPTVPAAIAMQHLPTIDSPTGQFSTSAASLMMPWEIAHVSLSSSP